MKLEQEVNYGSKEAVIQNLRDAGCTQELIECMLEQLAQEESGELLTMLEKHRDSLLAMVHEKEKQIGCLDYLVYQIRRSRRKEQEER